MARRGFADANADEFRFPALPPLVRGRSKMNSSANAFDALTVLVSARGKPSAARFRVPSIAALKGILDRLAC